MNKTYLLYYMDSKNREKKTRKPTAYNKFFKANYNSVRDKPPKERMKAIAKMWNDLTIEQKASYKRFNDDE